MMKNLMSNILIRCVIAVWLLFMGGYVPAYAVTYSTAYKPTKQYRQSGLSASNGVMGMYGQGEPTTSSFSAPSLSGGTLPSYKFQSTSALTPLMNNLPNLQYQEGAGLRTTSSLGWNEEDNPVGEVDDPVPVGEPLIMLLFVALYIVYRKKNSPHYTASAAFFD